MPTTKLELAELRTDGGTQPRAELDAETVTKYADDMRRGADFPPVKVMHDGQNHWLYDGFHRVQAARQIGDEQIEADVEQGTKEDAQWASLAANKRHGLRRSQADKRRAIKRALKGWGENKSNNQIAQHIGCSDTTVGKYRREMESASQIGKVDQRTGADGKTYDTSNIGEKSEDGCAEKKETWVCPICEHKWPETREKCLNCHEAERDDGVGRETISFPESEKNNYEGFEKSVSQQEREQKREQRKKEYKKERKPEPFPEEGEYEIIYADPPWQYNNSGLDDYGHAERHYDTMSIGDVCSLPVSRIVNDNCALYLWTTSPMLEESFRVINSWGFEYKTSFVWDKVKHNHGHYNSVRHEFLLVGTKGDGTPERSKLYDSVASIERGEHSEKPPYFRRMIDVLYPTSDKIELFARDTVSGWDSWGDEV